MFTRAFTAVVGVALVAVLAAMMLPDAGRVSAPGSEAVAHPAENALASKAQRRPAMSVATMRDTHANVQASARRPFNDVLDVPRAGLRKAVPVTRGQELGLRFRPDERDPIAGQGYPERFEQGTVQRFTVPGDSQFRPLPRERRRTYEDIQAESQAAQPQMVPNMPYPMLPVPPVGPGYWR